MANNEDRQRPIDLALARGWAVRWLAGTAAAQSVPFGAFAQWADRLDGNALQLVGSVIEAVTASADGAPVEGGVVHIPIRLNLKPEAK